MTGILSNLNRVVNHRPLFILFSLFLLVQTALFIKIGVFTGLEAEKYVTQGNLLYETGELSDTKYIFYLPGHSTCLFMPPAWHLLSSGSIHSSCSYPGFSLFCFYKLGRNIGNTTIAFYSSALLILFIPLQLWNFYLYSDSIFISLTIIYTYLIYAYGSKGVTGTTHHFIVPGSVLLFAGHMVYYLSLQLLFTCCSENNPKKSS